LGLSACTYLHRYRSIAMFILEFQTGDDNAQMMMECSRRHEGCRPARKRWTRW